MHFNNLTCTHLAPQFNSLRNPINLGRLHFQQMTIKTMKPFVLFIILLPLYHHLVHHVAEAAPIQTDDGIYIVYMGAAAPNAGSLRHDHLQLLNSITAQTRNAVVHTYRHGFSGFAARLSKEEARSMAETPGVVSVFPDPIIQLHTTRSWGFLTSQTETKMNRNPPSHYDSFSLGSDTVIGILDSGIWPESESFNDEGMGPIPSNWKGTCMEAHDFYSYNCNRKLIGARYYNSSLENGYQKHSPRDSDGHGTHVAATAAGRTVPRASYYGLAGGSAKGGSQWSRIATYGVCTSDGCRGSAILAGFDDAIADGVHVLSLSLGAVFYYRPSLVEDPIAIGAFHAVEHGIIVVCSAGNDGPATYTVVNVYPWILTVAASSIDRQFLSDLVLGNLKVIKGGAINFSPLKRSPSYPLVLGISAKKDGADESDARNCNPDSLEGAALRGSIVLCYNDDDQYSVEDKMEKVKSLGGIGIVLVDDESKAVPDNYGSFPLTLINSMDASEVLSYINTTRNPSATILPTLTILDDKPAPIIPFFSSRGPARDSLNILKPDISAPGVNILAAWIGNDDTIALKGKETPLFNIISGTSMACPHVSGLVASVRSQNPAWSPSAIKSSIMTTATQRNNLGGPITTDEGLVATPYDYGAGEVTISGPFQPGLVYESTTNDYLNYLCYSGEDLRTIKIISSSVPDDFSCPEDADDDFISNINYPSIAISKFKVEGKNISRTVTNVAGDGYTIYRVIVDAPREISVRVVPERLIFGRNKEKQSYQLIFSSTVFPLKKGQAFGSITWTNGKYKVRSPFVVKV